MATNTWAVILGSTLLPVPSFKVLAHNLTHEAARAQMDGIRHQKVERGWPTFAILFYAKAGRDGLMQLRLSAAF